MNFKKTLFCTLVGFLIAPLVNGASYIGDEEYPWYMHEVVGDGNANIIIIDNSDYNYSEVLYNNGTGKEYTDLVSEKYIDYNTPNPVTLTCPGYNLLAYNPDVTYLPWKGKDVQGNDFPDYRSLPLSALSSVRANPYFSASHKSAPIWNFAGYWDMKGSSNVANITGHKYQKWNGNQNSSYWKYDNDCGDIVSVATLSQEEQGNYANWFAYYRTRRHVQRAIASNIISKVDGPIAMNPVTVDFNGMIYASMVDLSGKPENSAERLKVMHMMYLISEKNIFGDAFSGWYRTALAATFQSLQHGGRTYQFNAAHMSNPPSDLTTIYPPAYGSYLNIVVSESYLQKSFEDNPCSIGKILMLAPGMSTNPDSENGNLVGWGIPCEPFSPGDIYSSSGGFPSNCKGGSAGFGDVDGAGDWMSARYNNTDQKLDYAGGVYAGNPLGSSFSNGDTTLADITMHYYMTDFTKSSAPDNPYIREKESDPHMIVDMAGFGVSTNRIETGYSGGSGWGDPNAGGTSPTNSQVIDRIDDLYHAAFNSRGNFISPRYPAELVSLLSSSGSPYNSVGDWSHYTSKTRGRVAKVEAAVISDTIVPSSLIPTLSDHWFFAGEYMTGTWSGDLKAYHYSQTQNKYGKFSTSSTNFSKGNVADGHVWSAEEKLKADLTNDDVIEWGNRKVFTLGNAGSGVLFSTDLNSSDKSKMINEKMVDTNDSGSADGGDVDDLINYIKGDSSNESYEMLRPRSSLIGDIINSNPTYVDGSTPMVYVGSNDGMLHGFDAKTGSEIFAYVPATLFPELYKLGLTEDFKHKMMVDGPVSVYDVGSKKMLFSGLGHGGKGYFALNVTNPKASASSIVEWEINSDNSEYSDMGYTFATLKVIEVGGQKYGLIANGYDSDNGNAVLYLVDLADGSKVGAVSISGGGGLSTPAVVVKSSSEVYAYAGAMDGNVYKFKVSLTASGAILNGSSSPFYDGSSDQPITVEPAIVRNHPATGEQGVLIAFGTGRYLTKEDHNDGSENAKNQIGENIPAPKTQAIYVIGDHDVSDMTSGNFGSSSLLQRTYSEVSSGDNEYRISDYPLEEGKANFALWGKDNWFDGNDGTMRGWYIELSHAERVISKPYIFAHKTTEFKIEDSDDNDNQTNYQAGIVVFSTLIPGCNECDNATSGWLMALRAYDGKANYMSFDTTDDHVLNDSNSDAEKKGGSATTGYCGIKQDDGQFAVSGFTMVKRLNDTYEAKFREDDNKPNGDNFGTVDLVGVAAGKTKIYNVTIRNNDIGDKPDENPPAPRRISWKELRRNH